MTTERIWNDFKSDLLRFIQSRINDRDLANDILQDVFVKIHANLNALNTNTSLISWVYRITRNTIIDHYRRKKILVYKEDIQDLLSEEEPSQVKDFSQCLGSFIAQLPDKDREALEKTGYGKMSQKTYAELTNESYSAVKSRVQRARKKVKDLFVDCCGIQTDKYGNVIDDNCNCENS